MFTTFAIVLTAVTVNGMKDSRQRFENGIHEISNGNTGGSKYESMPIVKRKSEVPNLKNENDNSEMRWEGAKSTETNVIIGLQSAFVGSRCPTGRVRFGTMCVSLD